MTKLKTLNDTLAFIQKQHGKELMMGVNCYSSLRDNFGKKTVFSITKGAQFTEYNISGADSVTIEHMVRGVSPRKTTPRILSHQFCLSGLRMVNIYESFTEFLTTSKMDFMYCVKGGPQFSLLAALDFIPPQNILGQWSYKDEQLDDSLEHLGKTVIIEREGPFLNLDFS